MNRTDHQIRRTSIEEGSTSWIVYRRSISCLEFISFRRSSSSVVRRARFAAFMIAVVSSRSFRSLARRWKRVRLEKFDEVSCAHARTATATFLGVIFLRFRCKRIADRGCSTPNSSFTPRIFDSVF